MGQMGKQVIAVIHMVAFKKPVRILLFIVDKVGLNNYKRTGLLITFCFVYVTALYK
jgi:hypothetical protein